VARISVDYDLMYVLARHIWHLRDELDVPVQLKHSFDAGDIGPRPRTAEALENFSVAWRKAFSQGWQAMTDLGDLLDETGKAFYDGDASMAANAASMAATYERHNAKAANDAYRQRRDAAREQAEAENLERRHEAAQRPVERQRQQLERKRAALQKEQDAQTKRQEDLNKRQDELQKRQEPLRQRYEELTGRQQDLWRRQKAERAELEADFTAKQDALNKEQAALAKEKEPSRERVEELQRKQRDLWEEQDAAQKALEGKQEKEQNDLNRARDDLRREQDAFTPEQDELDREQHDLWKGQAATEGAQEQLDKDEEQLRKRAEDVRKDVEKDYAEEQKEREKSPSTADNGESDLTPSKGGPGEAPPPPEPTTYERDDENGHTKIEYKMNADGEIEVDKNGNPVETTTTITNKNGLTYTETYRSLPREGDSVTTTHRSDGSVTKVYVDSNPEGYGPGESMRYVTDDKGAPLETWRKTPDGEWGKVWDSRSSSPDEKVAEEENAVKAEEAANGVGRPPAYLTVEKPLVDGAGRPADDSFSPPMDIKLPDGNVRTDYMREDGSELRVVTTDTTRYVADANNEIQEVWYKNRSGTWYLKESSTQHTRYGDEPPLGTLGENWR
jgi:chemotaxis protein histidine kinase CheA